MKTDTIQTLALLLLLAGVCSAEQKLPSWWKNGSGVTNKGESAVRSTQATNQAERVMPTWWKPGGAAGGRSRSGGKKAKGLVVDGSIFYPTYIAEGTVYTRGVADMPLAANSARIAKYMPTLPAKYNKMGVVTSLNATFYNLPIYIVDSRDPATPRVKVTYPSFRHPSATMQKILFSDDIPLPAYAKSANPQHTGDHALAIYDIGTGIIREYFYMMKKGEGLWEASWAGYYKDMWSLASENYACQHTEGSDFVTAMIGAPGQIGIEEARRGEVRHAICFTTANARKGVTCWPAKQNDGTDDNPDAPAEGQWFRINPSVKIDGLNLRPFTRLLVETVQKYGGFASDKNLFCHAFNAEPGFVEEHKTGQDPWTPGGDLHEKYSGCNVNDFPWHLTEWAPIDWGKPKN